MSGFQSKREAAADKLQEPSYTKEKPKLMLEKFREMKNLLDDTAPPQRPWVGLTNDERKALERFTDTCDDGEGYDVPKQMMQRLAQIGVVNHTSGGIYSTTEFGRWVIDAAPPQRERVVFPTLLRKMWSGGEVQAWLDENVNKEKNNGT